MGIERNIVGTAMWVPDEPPATTADVLQKAIWDAVEVHIDGCPVDGINAEGEFNQSVQYQQATFVDGLRAARLAAMAAVAKHFNAKLDGAA